MEVYFERISKRIWLSLEFDNVSTDPELYRLDRFCWEMCSVEMFETELDLSEIALLWIRGEDPRKFVYWVVSLRSYPLLLINGLTCGDSLRMIGKWQGFLSRSFSLGSVKVGRWKISLVDLVLSGVEGFRTNCWKKLWFWMFSFSRVISSIILVFAWLSSPFTKE